MTRLLLLFISCSVLISVTSAQCTVERANPRFSRAVYEFSAELSSRIGHETEYHFVSSPLSAWTLISAISEGASGDTLTEIQRVLKHHPQRCFNRKFYDLVKLAASGNDDATVEKSGAIIIDERMLVKPGFKKSIERLGISKVLIESFNRFDETSRVINAFVQEATHGVIDEIIQPEDLQNKYLIMIDAIYFKGKWKQPFSETELSAFYDDQENNIGDVDLMYVLGQFNVTKIDLIHSVILELPYSGDRFSMLVFLPTKGVRLSQVLDSLKLISIKSIFNSFGEPTVLSVQFPKFKISSNLDNLKELLSDMGLRTMFDDHLAEFPSISVASLYVSDFIQKADIEVSEEGTVAAATSEAFFTGRSMPMEFSANRPFAYMIVDRLTEAVLFSGAFSKPNGY